MVHGILLGRVPVGDVEDLVQDVFVQAMRQVHTLREVAWFGGWLATVTRNRANDYHRRSVDQVEFAEEAHAGAGDLGRGSTPRHGALLVIAAPALAGPPLICHSIDIGTAPSLPWTSSGWNLTGQETYDVNHLVTDTLSLLTANTPVLMRMETLQH